MAKLVDPLRFVIENLQICPKYLTGQYKGRQVRYLENCGVLQIGELDFDRWANSVDLEFDLFQAKGQRKLLRWCNG